MGSEDKTNAAWPKRQYFFNPFPNVYYYKYVVPQRMDGVEIWHLIESKYSSVESHNQQVRGFVHRSTSDTTMFPGKQVSAVEEDSWERGL